MYDNLSYIVWDWHGVLGTKGFWYKASKSNPSVKQLASYIFSDKTRVNSWMRGERSVGELIIESGVNISEARLAKYLLEDWGETDAINTQLFDAIKGLFNNARHIIITDNMDVFDTYYQTNSFLLSNFEHVFNSSTYGTLKDDMPGLFELAQSKLKLDSFDGCLLLDDSKTNCNRFEQLGGRTVLIGSKYSEPSGHL